MELRTIAGRLRAGDIFKLVATGYLIGMGAIFVPLFLLLYLLMMATGELTRAGDAAGTGLLPYLMPVVLVPFVIGMQAVMIGGGVTLGLWLYQTQRPIRIVAEDAGGGPAA